jgi:hypothetical protein
LDEHDNYQLLLIKGMSVASGYGRSVFIIVALGYRDPRVLRVAASYAQ